ncbi:MAG: hypothetical protein GY847_34855 [Proteobacteria bacterium]|nr:hypothetical protein [Pseudomonadota bacterium]
MKDQIDRLEGDERAIVSELLKRLEMGRNQYGPWDTDDAREYGQEALEEVLDALLYIAALLVKLKRQ